MDNYMVVDDLCERADDVVASAREADSGHGSLTREQWVVVTTTVWDSGGIMLY